MDITLIVIGLYFVVLILFGIFVNRSNGSKDFATAKGSLGVLAITAGLVMTHYGGGFILGGAELGYKNGFYGLAYGVAAAIGVLFLGLFLSKRISKENRGKITTVPLFLFKKFNDKKLFYLASILSIVALVAIASAQIFAAMKILSVLNIPVRASCVIITLIICLIAMKGMAALTRSGKYNLIIASIGAIFAILLALKMPSQLISKITFDVMPISNILWIIIPTVMYTMIGQDFHQKIYSAKSHIVARNACILASIILFLLSFFPVIIGMKSRELFVVNASSVLPQFILYSMPSVFKGLFIAAILAAVIGSAQSVINSAATQVSEDLFGHLRKKSSKFFGSIAPISAVIISIIAFILTLFSTSIVNSIVLAYTFYTASMFVPVIAAFILRKGQISSGDVFIIAVVGLASAIIFEFFIKTTIPSILISVIVSMIFLLIVYLLNRNEIYKGVNS